MKFLDLTLPTPAENLACDEALLDLCDEGRGDEVLRFWESPTPFVVLGYSNKAAAEVNLESCRRDGVPVLRRVSGGGAVVQGPGCLNYALILRIPDSGPLAHITDTNHFIMQRHAAALNAEVRGHTDLALGELKFSGNSQRRKRRALLFHGTFLLNFDLAGIERWLRMPSREPDYRQQRSHRQFLTNLDIPATTIKSTLTGVWNATAKLPAVPRDRIAQLVAERYATNAWSFKF
jgi:lipoate-protein ligase A